jgi:nucleoside-diphosphate-sugar epimerase
MGSFTAPGKHVLVVGGAGYIGSVLVRDLLRSGHRVRVLDNLLFENGAAIAGLDAEPGFSFVHGDLTRAADRERSLEGITDVVLLAALVGDAVCKSHPSLARRVNLDAAIALLEASNGNGVERFVFTSTCSNYGLREAGHEPVTEAAELHPLSHYSDTKVAFERHVLDGAGGEPGPTILRVGTAYGLSPRMRFDLTIAEFTRTLAIGEELLVYDADTWRPYCHVGDISEAIRLVLDAGVELVAGEVFNVGGGEENYTKRVVAETVRELVGPDARVRYVEGGGDRRNYRVSFEKIRGRLGFEPSRRMPETVDALVEAIASGRFDDLDARPSFYANYALEAPDAEAETATEAA